MFDVDEELKKLPDSPGVYIMHDAADTIIYVGKAVNLKRRVSQYFKGKEYERGPKIAKMISLIDHFEYIVVKSELEALVLECNLIKENRPKYNTMLMDDKTYPFVKVTLYEKYPRVFLTRKHTRDKAKYFGPFTNVTAVRDTLKLLQNVYPYRNCEKVLDGSKVDRPCLYYQIGQCSGPCSGEVSEEEYKKGIDAIIAFFEGDTSGVKKTITDKMMAASEEMKYEEAQKYKEMLAGIDSMQQVQRVTSSDDANRDVIGLAQAGVRAIAQIFFIRGGRLVGREHYYINAESTDKAQALTQFVKQYYGGVAVVPREILLSENIEEEELIAEWLSNKAEAKVKLTTPAKGDKKKLVELAKSNAETVLKNDLEKLIREAAKTTGAVAELGTILRINPPLRIESFDISNINGFDQVGSMVVYENGAPKKSDYRRFRIKTVNGADDYGCMREVLTRRFEHSKRNLEENDSFAKLPDLIMMDGGRGQVNIALQVIEEFALNIKVCGMVKDDNHRTRALLFNDEELDIDTHSELFKLITRIQDETHRFAIEYHKSLRSKDQVKSILDDIPDVGSVRRKTLMSSFESIDELKAASIEKLESLPNMNKRAAESVYGFFHKEKAGSAESGETGDSTEDSMSE